MLAPGGQLRFSVLADPTDQEGLVTSTEQTEQNTEALVAD